jgi:hypothetical protein
MIRIIVNNLYDGSSKVYELERVYDFDKMAADFGPTINSIVGDTQNLRSAADRVAKYLSNHHLQAEVIDPQDNEEIYDPNIEDYKTDDKKPKKAIDLKDVLESYNEIENVDIPPMHVLKAAAPHWDT